MTNQIVAFDITAITKALGEAMWYITMQQKVKPTEPLQWTCGNEQQVRLMQRFEPLARELTNLPELQAWARKTAEELNQILADRGFSIRLEPWEESPTRFGVVAIFDITIEWLVTGSVEDDSGRPHHLPLCNKPAYRLPEGEARVEFHQVDDHIIVRIPGKKAGDYLCLTRMNEPADQFSLLSSVEHFRRHISDATRMRGAYSGVVLPNIVFDVEPNIDWLVGLSTTDAAGAPWEITQALMEIKFAMGPKGARAKVAVAFAVESFCIGDDFDYVVDHDILVWMERESVTTEPFFVAYVPASAFADHTVNLDEI